MTRRFALLLALPLVGCASPRISDTARASHVVVLPGIAGADVFNRRMAQLIDQEVPNVSAELWDWTAVEPPEGLSSLPNLTDYERNQRRAEVLAAQLVAWHKRHPRVRLSLVGMSGGVGMALFAVEKLPEELSLDRLVFISGATAPDYDLRPALRRCRGGIWNYYSHLDVAILDRGTRAAGTMDRQFVTAAGCLGFNVPDDPAFAARLHQLAWTPRMLALGNDGSHLGGLAMPFLRKYVLPLFAGSDALVSHDWRVVEAE